MQIEDQLFQDRLARRNAIKDLDLDPYGHKFEGLTSIDTIRRQYKEDVPCVTVFKAAGRVVSKNGHGKLIFFHIVDSTGSIQILASKADLWDGASSIQPIIVPEAVPMPWGIVQNIQPGDIVGVEGTLTVTKTKEISLRITDVTMLAKSLATPPDKFHGLTDPEKLVRNRHLELIYKEGAVKTLKRRSEMVWKIRNCLNKHGFMEVETPILQPIASGATARPFKTHHNAHSTDLYLRIAPELYLKRLLVGGMEKIFEIGKNFRNEGIDKTHNPEFTMLELYEAYGDYESMQYITRKIAEAVGLDIIANAKVVTYSDLFDKYCNIKLLERVSSWDMPGYPHNDAQSLMQGDMPTKLQWTPNLKQELAWKSSLPETTPLDQLLDAVFDKIIQPQLIEPVFVVCYPTVSCLFAKPMVASNNYFGHQTPNWEGFFCERWELFADGMELANAYTELNDPDLQQRNFEVQLGLEPGTRDPRIDYDFLDSLIVGMPPAGGLGIGIDRLAMLVAGTDAIRDVITFPLVRPVVEQ